MYESDALEISDQGEWPLTNQDKIHFSLNVDTLYTTQFQLKYLSSYFLPIKHKFIDVFRKLQADVTENLTFSAD